MNPNPMKLLFLVPLLALGLLPSCNRSQPTPTPAPAPTKPRLVVIPAPVPTRLAATLPAPAAAPRTAKPPAPAPSFTVELEAFWQVLATTRQALAPGRESARVCAKPTPTPSQPSIRRNR